MLVLCVHCERHIKAQSEACPFCNGAVVAAPETRPRRVARAVMMAGASALAAVACSSPISPQPAYGACIPPPTSVTLDSPCGFASVTTSCSGTVSHVSATEATVGPVTADCSIDVTLGDATTHTVQVTFGTVMPGGFCGNQTLSGVTSSAEQSFGSTTCTALDAGADASDAAGDL